MGVTMGNKNSKTATTKALRVLDIYKRLCEGKIISKEEETLRFNVDERTIQRDIDEIRVFLKNSEAETGNETREIVYDYNKKGFVMTGMEAYHMSNTEILAVSKVLLESRAFTKKEMNSILDKMLLGCVPVSNMKMVSELISNEKYHYVEPMHKKELKDILWDFGEDIKLRRVVEISYEKANGDRVKYFVEPVGILFSEYYFYLNAYISVENEDGEFDHKYEFPGIFRLDRVKKRRDTGAKFRVIYGNRFEEGEFRKRIQFMYGGKLLRFKFLYTSYSLGEILDRLPTARVLEKNENGYVIYAEVYGPGVIMWLLSQGDFVEVLEPASFREEIKELLQKMLDKYL